MFILPKKVNLKNAFFDKHIGPFLDSRQILETIERLNPDYHSSKWLQNLNSFVLKGPILKTLFDILVAVFEVNSSLNL